MSNYYDCVQMLVKHDAIIEINDNQGRNPLIWAFMQGKHDNDLRHKDILKYANSYCHY
jgi:ankyrin repeat protein